MTHYEWWERCPINWRPRPRRPSWARHAARRVCRSRAEQASLARAERDLIAADSPQVLDGPHAVGGSGRPAHPATAFRVRPAGAGWRSAGRRHGAPGRPASPLGARRRGRPGHRLAAADRAVLDGQRLVVWSTAGTISRPSGCCTPALRSRVPRPSRLAGVPVPIPVSAGGVVLAPVGLRRPIDDDLDGPLVGIEVLVGAPGVVGVTVAGQRLPAT